MTQRVVIYARVSTDDQDCTRQVEELTSWAARQGAFIVGTYEETGSGADAARTARKAVLELCRKRLCDVVLVTEASRWSRSVPDLLETLEALAGYGVSLRALNGLELDLATATGRMMVTILGAISEFERGLLRERVKSGLASAKRRGIVLGGHRGERVSKAARLADTVQALTSQGLTIRQIATKLQIAPGTVQKARRLTVE